LNWIKGQEPIYDLYISAQGNQIQLYHWVYCDVYQ
jgi:hypothetical protein